MQSYVFKNNFFKKMKQIYFKANMNLLYIIKIKKIFYLQVILI